MQKAILKYNLRKMYEKFMLWFIWLLPRNVIYWCSIRLIAHATQGEYGNTIVPELGAMDALGRWE